MFSSHEGENLSEGRVGKAKTKKTTRIKAAEMVSRNGGGGKKSVDSLSRGLIFGTAR